MFENCSTEEAKKEGGGGKLFTFRQSLKFIAITDTLWVVLHYVRCQFYEPERWSEGERGGL